MFSYYRQLRVKVNQMYFSENTMFSNFLFMSFLYQNVLVLIKKQKGKMLKRKIRMDIDAWLVDEDDDSTEDNLNELMNLQDDIIEDEGDSAEEDKPYQQQKGNYFRKQLTHNREKEENQNHFMGK